MQCPNIPISHQSKPDSYGFPLSVYEAIDETRGAVPFSEFVANVLKE